MKIELVDEERREQWESYIDENPKAIAWQSFKWYDVVQKHYRVKFYPLAALKDNTITGVLPLYHVRIPFSKEFLSSVPCAVAGGIVASDEESERMLLEKAFEIAGSHNNCNIIFKQYKHKIKGELSADENFINKELSLGIDIDKIWNEIANNNRENITAGKKYDYKVEHPSQDINGFYNFLFRHHKRKGVPCTSKSWIRDLVISGMYSIALLKLNEKIIAATMVKEFKDTISFPFSSTSDPGSEYFHLIYSLYWELIKKYAMEGKNIFHSGRLSKAGGAEDFRQGWGGTAYNYYYQYYPQTIRQTEFKVKRNAKREAFEKIWKLTPSPITRLIGPMIVKRFP